MFKLVFPCILMLSFLIVLISGIKTRYNKEEFMSLDEFIRDWLLDHGQGHKLEEQFNTMKKEPTGILYMPLTYKGAKVFMKIGLTPNKVSVINLIFSFLIFYGVVMAGSGHSLDLFTEQPFYGMWFVAIAFLILGTGIIDGIDGAMARLLDKKSKSGAWFDNIIDRISDILMLVGLIPGTLLEVPNAGLDLAWIVWTNCFLIQIYEYMRARHEGLGLHELKPFIGERPMRIMILASFFLVYGISSLSIFITNLINPELSQLWSVTHPSVIAWSIILSQGILLLIMILSSIQLGKYSYKHLKELDEFTEK